LAFLGTFFGIPYQEMAVIYCKRIICSEEIFDFSKGSLTQSKILYFPHFDIYQFFADQFFRELKTTLNEEFYLIFQLFQHITKNSTNGKLLLTTLETMHRYLNWIPVGYVFETDLVQVLVTKFFPVDEFRSLTLKCLTEIAGLDAPQGAEEKFAQLYLGTMVDVNRFMPPGTGIVLLFPLRLYASC
jgi:exportin-1